MRHLALRAGLLSVLTFGLFAGSGFAYFEFPDTPQASAQQAPVAPVASPTASATGTAQPAAAVAPTPTATPVPPSPSATATDAATATGAAAATGTATASATPTVMPTATVVSVANLPVLTARPDAPGTAVQTTIDVTGGKVASPDGRVSVDVPPGVFQAPMKITMTRRDHKLLPSPSPDLPLAAVWQFDAVTADAAATPVHRFSANVTISVHLSAVDLDGRNPATLAFWTFDDALRQWVRVPGAVDAQTRTLTVGINHFSTDGATADLINNQAPLLDGHNVGLHSGTASLSIPIAVPPGRGGLTPQLALSYDSGRADEMRHYTSLASWAGLGWDLGTGSVTISAAANGNTRAFLSASAFGGEMMPDGTTDAGKSVWRLRDEAYVRVRTTCYGNPFAAGHVTGLCTWWVTDKDGRVYTYGGDLAHARYSMIQYSTLQGITWGQDFYQFDLASISDPLGNRADFAYTQYTATDQVCNAAPYYTRPLGCTYDVSAYPATISYNYNTATPPVAQTVIQFNTGCDGTPGVSFFYPGTGPAVCIRDDTPRNFPVAGSCNAYTAPLVMETQRLNSIDVRQGGQLARHYDLAHTTTPFYRLIDGPVPSCSPYVGYITCSPDQFGRCLWPPSGTPTANYVGGTDLLTGLSIKGADGTTGLLSMAFQYTPKHIAFIGGWDYNWQHLTQADNGLGGHVLFQYAELSVGGNSNWSREVVQQQTKQAGLAEPDVVTNYVYANGPAFQLYPDPYAQPYWYPGAPGVPPDWFNALYRGFGQVTETDAAGNQTVHNYYTTGNYCCGSGYASPPYPTTPSDWVNEILNGREYQTQWKDGSNTVWKTVTSTFASVALANSYTPPPQSQGQSFINFIYPLQVATTLKDASQTYSQNQFDSLGNQALNNDFVGTAPTNPTQLSTCSAATGCMLSTSTAYALDTTDWIFRPRYVAKTDRRTATRS